MGMSKHAYDIMASNITKTEANFYWHALTEVRVGRSNYMHTYVRD